MDGGEPGACRLQAGSTLQAPPMMVRFTESDDRGWQAVPGGTPASGNLPPGCPRDAGAAKLKDSGSECGRYFFKCLSKHSIFLVDSVNTVGYGLGWRERIPVFGVRVVL